MFSESADFSDFFDFFVVKISSDHGLNCTKKEMFQMGSVCLVCFVTVSLEIQ
jgi:hypothetical protein